VSGNSAFSGHTRANDGVIVTLVDLDSGKSESRHLGGVMARRIGGRDNRPPQRIIAGVNDLRHELAAELDEREGDWRIRSISTPSTILTDLLWREGNSRIPMPEAVMLTKIGRTDLLERPLRFPGVS
jgi:hypothetical protein